MSRPKAAKVSPEDKPKLDRWQKRNPLRKFRKKNNLSPAEVAEKMDVSVQMVMLWENGIAFDSVGSREHFPPVERFRRFIELKWHKDGLTLEAWDTWFRGMPQVNVLIS